VRRTAPCPPARASGGTLVALGGNAFARPGVPLTSAGQVAFAANIATRLLPTLKASPRALLLHGNGPQVGYMLARVEAAPAAAYAQPLDICVAETEGELGYVLAQALINALRASGHEREVVTVLTQVLVDTADPAFAQPAKPVGGFHTAAEAARMRARGHAMQPDAAGRGFRRVVASPRPLAVLEAAVIARLVDARVLVIAAGGGGIPVREVAGRIEGVEAVVDKDASAALLANALDFDTLLMLTDVPQACRDFGRPGAQGIGRTTPAELATLAAAGHFAAGSMLPKVEAACAFVDRAARRAIICAPDNLEAALAGMAGTRVEHA
jgi:carbamate kinase